MWRAKNTITSGSRSGSSSGAKLLYGESRTKKVPSVTMLNVDTLTAATIFKRMIMSIGTAINQAVIQAANAKNGRYRLFPQVPEKK